MRDLIEEYFNEELSSSDSKNSQTNLKETLATVLPNNYTRSGIKEDGQLLLVGAELTFEKSFFQALESGDYVDASGNRFSEAKVARLRHHVINYMNAIKPDAVPSKDIENMQRDTGRHIKRNLKNLSKLTKGLPELLVKERGWLHDRIKLVTDVNELYELGYLKEIKTPLFYLMVLNKKFHKSDNSLKRAKVYKKDGKSFDLLMAFQIHELNRMETNEVIEFYLNNGLAQPRYKGGQLKVQLTTTAALFELFDFVVDLVDAIAREDLGDPSKVEFAAEYYSKNNGKAKEVNQLVKALGGRVNNVKMLFNYFESNGFNMYLKGLGQLVDHKMIRERVRAHLESKFMKIKYICHSVFRTSSAQ